MDDKKEYVEKEKAHLRTWLLSPSAIKSLVALNNKKTKEDKVRYLAQQSEKNWHTTDKLIDICCDLKSKLDYDTGKSEKEIRHSAITIVPAILGLSCLEMMAETREISDKKVLLSKVTGIPVKDITGYDSDFTRGVNKYRGYVGSLKATHSKERLINLQAILGNLDLRSLSKDKLDVLKNLKIVIGDLYLHSGDEHKLPSLEFVTGNIYPTLEDNDLYEIAPKIKKKTK